MEKTWHKNVKLLITTLYDHNPQRKTQLTNVLYLPSLSVPTHWQTRGLNGNHQLLWSFNPLFSVVIWAIVSWLRSDLDHLYSWLRSDLDHLSPRAIWTINHHSTFNHGTLMLLSGIWSIFISLDYNDRRIKNIQMNRASNISRIYTVERKYNHLLYVIFYITLNFFHWL
jgi:hypothetical protein